MALNKTPVPSLPVEELLCYLCIHGTRHRWLYLDLVCCVSELIRSCKDIEWLQAWRFAARIHCTTVLLLGLGLSRKLMQAEIPEYLTQLIDSSPRINKLVEELSQDLFSGYGAGMVVPDTFDLHQLKVKDRFYDKVLYVGRVVFIPTKVDLRVFPLPETLAFVRYFLRPVRLGWEYFSRRVSK